MTAPWRAPFETALRAHAPLAELQVATSSPEGMPSVRTVILRGVSVEGFLYFFTDARSRKADHLRGNPRVALHAWFPLTREQFRLSGRATLHGTHAENPWAELRQQAWGHLEPDARQPFVGAPPGHLAITRVPVEVPAVAPPEFLVISVEVTDADWLALGPPATRAGFRKVGAAWIQQSLTP
jgi:hypothetical protein